MVDLNLDFAMRREKKMRRRFNRHKLMRERTTKTKQTAICFVLHKIAYHPHFADTHAEYKCFEYRYSFEMYANELAHFLR